MSAVIEKALIRARDAFGRNVTRNVDFRIGQLKQLRKCIDENYDKLVGALKDDFRKPKLETVITEIEYVKNDIQYQLDHIHRHIGPQYVQKGMPNLFDDAYIKYDPYGVVLIFSAWNYPIQLLLGPVVGAIAAGNCALIKPSEVSPNTEQLMAKLLPQYLDKDCYHVITGGADVASQVLSERFDLVFFTGSTSIGKIVYQAASKHMTPVVLELGGKSPVYIDESVGGNLEVAAKRIMWGKFVNAGQTCIAPDYVLCTAEVQDRFVKAAQKVLKDFYSENPQKSDDLARIINARNFARLDSMLKTSKGTVSVGGVTEGDSRYISPTIVSNVSPNDSLMSEELFGPILPIVTVGSDQEAIDFINRGEKPLSMYLFSNEKAVVKRFLDQTSSGSVCVNDTLMQAAIHSLPFGGVGSSGIGKYHGKFSFETFSHSKAVLAKDYNPLVEYLAGARYPPYSDSKLKMLKNLIAPTPLDEVQFKKIFTLVAAFLVGLGTMFVLKASG